MSTRARPARAQTGRAGVGLTIGPRAAVTLAHPARPVLDLRHPVAVFMNPDEPHQRVSPGLDRAHRGVRGDPRTHQRGPGYLRRRRARLDRRGVRQACRGGRRAACGDRRRGRHRGIDGPAQRLLIVRLGITPIIVTLGTLYFARGLAFLIAEGRSVVTGLPTDFSVPGRTYLGPIPTPVIVTVVVVVIFFILLHRSLLGKYTYAIGGNRETALLSGISVGRVQGSLYVLSGLVTGIAGVILASRLGSGQPDAGAGFEFEVIVAIIVGGTSLAGGQGTIVGTVIGALIVAVLGNGLNLLGVQTFYQYIILGIALIIAVLLDMTLKRRAQAAGGTNIRPGRAAPTTPVPVSTGSMIAHRPIEVRRERSDRQGCHRHRRDPWYRSRSRGGARAGRRVRDGVRTAIRTRRGRRRGADRAGHPTSMGSSPTSRSPPTSRPSWRATVARFGGVDILINSAGIQRYGNAIDTDEALWDRVQDVNVKGMFLTAKYVIPEMRRRGGGSIVNVSSVQAFIALKDSLAYVTSKGAINSLTRALALDHASEGIRVNAVCPARSTPRCCAGQPTCSEAIAARTTLSASGVGCTRSGGSVVRTRWRHSSCSSQAPGPRSSPGHRSRWTAGSCLPLRWRCPLTLALPPAVTTDRSPCRIPVTGSTDAACPTSGPIAACGWPSLRTITCGS